MYKEKVLNKLKRLKQLQPYELVKLTRYYVEYLRELAKANNINPVTEYKWTSKVIELYTNRGYPEVGEVMMILDMYKDILPLYITHTDFGDVMKLVVTASELDTVNKVLDLLSK